MNFNLRHADDEPEINLVPLIDILLVILIFFAATTSFLRVSQLDIHLPQAGNSAQIAESISIIVSQDGRYSINDQIVTGSDSRTLVSALSQARAMQPDAPLLIHADAQSTHESVIHVMQAARQAGIARINFAVQGDQ